MISLRIRVMGAMAVLAFARVLVAGDEVELEQVAPGSRAAPDAGEGVAPDDPKLNESFGLINRSTSLMGWDRPNPVALVRAVNDLRGLGKEQAIATLRAYVRYAPVAPPWKDVHLPDQQRICWIVPLLFAPADEWVRLPSLGRDPKEWSRGGWKGLNISEEGDLPFHDSAANGRTGTPDPPRQYLVEWADKHGVLIKEPLRPTNDPLLAADKLCDSLLDDAERRVGRSYKERLRVHVRLQARRTIEHLFPADERMRWDNDQLSDGDWQKLKAAAENLKIRWDEKEQGYVARAE